MRAVFCFLVVGLLYVDLLRIWSQPFHHTNQTNASFFSSANRLSLRAQRRWAMNLRIDRVPPPPRIVVTLCFVRFGSTNTTSPAFGRNSIFFPRTFHTNRVLRLLLWTVYTISTCLGWVRSRSLCHAIPDESAGYFLYSTGRLDGCREYPCSDLKMRRNLESPYTALLIQFEERSATVWRVFSRTSRVGVSFRDSFRIKRRV